MPENTLKLGIIGGALDSAIGRLPFNDGGSNFSDFPHFAAAGFFFAWRPA